MTTANVGGEIQFHCDACPEYVDSEETEWSAAYNAVKRDGWIAKKVGNKWEHRCPSCAEEERERQ